MESEAGAKVRINIELTNFCTMKVYEMLKIMRGGLKMMSERDVLRDDWRYASLVDEYRTMRSNGLKHQAAVVMLSGDYHVSIRTVERILKRLCRDC